MIILPDGSGGYVLDGWGGLHAFAIGSGAMPPPMATAYWPGSDLARDIDFDIGLSTIGGVTLDAWGGVHPFGSEPSIAQPGHFWPPQDVARAVRLDDSGAQPSEGWILEWTCTAVCTRTSPTAPRYPSLPTPTTSRQSTWRSSSALAHCNIDISVGGLR